MRLRNFVSCARKNSVFSWLCSLFLSANQHFLICLEIDKNPVFLKFLIKQFTLTLKKKLKNAFVQSLSDNIISNKFLFTENKKVHVIPIIKLICKNIISFFNFRRSLRWVTKWREQILSGPTKKNRTPNEESKFWVRQFKNSFNSVYTRHFQFITF